jgi:hypothetical protein
MPEFGKQLRKFRQQCNDANSPHGKLTQEKFGELMGRELGINYSGAAVSDWERGKSRIQADDRFVLMAVVRVLQKYGGLRTIRDANQLLEAGNYRALNRDEAQYIFGEALVQSSAEQSIPEQKAPKSSSQFLLENLIGTSENELKAALAKAEEGPSPSWPRKLAVLMRKASAHWSLSISSVLWIATWAIAWWLITPSLRWPFEDRASAYSAIVMYVGGTLAIPLLIGLLVTTKDSQYWKQQGLAGSKILRLYTYQGAGIGFNLGYFFVLPLVFLRFYLQLGSSIWLELAAVTIGLILGNMAARVVPHNLWLAYGRLRFADGAIFFVVALLGLMWGVFFMEFYSVLLVPFLGTFVILSAVTMAVIIAKRQPKKRLDSSGNVSGNRAP